MDVNNLRKINEPAHQWLGYIVENCLSLQENHEDPVTNLVLVGGQVVVDVEVNSVSDSFKRDRSDESLNQSANNWMADQLQKLGEMLDDDPTLQFTLDGAVINFKLMEIKGHYLRKKVKINL